MTIRKNGRPRLPEGDLGERREAYLRWKSALGMTAKELARITGLLPSTHGAYPGTGRTAPTWETISLMRDAAMRRATKVYEMAVAELESPW